MKDGILNASICCKYVDWRNHRQNIENNKYELKRKREKWMSVLMETRQSITQARLGYTIKDTNPFINN